MTDFTGKARAPLITLGLVWALIVGSGMASACADEFRARYTVSLIGFPIGEAAAAGSLGPASYRIDLSAKLTGVAAIITNVKLALAATGALRRGGVAPSTYATTSANSQGSRTVRMSLDAGNVKAVEIFPPFEDKEGRVPVTAANKRNILDPATALIMVVPEGQPVVGSRCLQPDDPGLRRLRPVRCHPPLCRRQRGGGRRDTPARFRSAPRAICPSPGHKRDPNRRNSWPKTGTSRLGSRRSRGRMLSCSLPCRADDLGRHGCHRRRRIFGRAFGPDSDHHALMARRRGIT